jgi:hypothetical protein
VNPQTTPETHALTHVTMSGPRGERLTPACVCGWWSTDGSHAAFERHLHRHTPRKDQP